MQIIDYARDILLVASASACLPTQILWIQYLIGLSLIR